MSLQCIGNFILSFDKCICINLLLYPFGSIYYPSVKLNVMTRRLYGNSQAGGYAKPLILFWEGEGIDYKCGSSDGNGSW